MKHLNKIIIAVVLFAGLNTQAQDSNNPWAVSFGVNALDTKMSAGGGNNWPVGTWFDSHFSQAFSVKDNWNILPVLSYVGVTRYVGDNFSVGISGSINKVSKYVTHDYTGYKVSNPGDLKYYGIEGYSVLGDNTYQTVSPGIGVIYWASKTVGLEYTSKYVSSFEEREILKAAHAPTMLQHSFGLVVKFGEK